ncbi:transposable element Tcb2 transposase [Trichonephila clavipes]|nr:transposable element Tcb2 transposase [Trichonephila clavipes]
MRVTGEVSASSRYHSNEAKKKVRIFYPSFFLACWDLDDGIVLHITTLIRPPQSASFQSSWMDDMFDLALSISIANDVYMCLCLRCRKIVVDSRGSPAKLPSPHRPNGNVMLSKMEKSVEGFRKINLDCTKLLGAVHTRRYPRAENGSGATRKTTRREDRRIVRQAVVVPTVARSMIRADVGVAIVPQTISRHLAEANLKFKRPFHALPLTPEHRQLRLQWCQARSMWNVTDWQNVVFSDESRFVLGIDDNRVRVWRRPGERYNSPHTVLRHTVRTAGVMVWGAIAYDSRSPLIVMHGTLTGQRYVDDILRPHVGPFLNGLPGAIFQQDNARPHTARVAQDFLRHFQTLPWPARSPNLSPVEHVWDQLKRQMLSCHSVQDLELAVQDLWVHLPQDNIRCLINSMPDCVAACFAAGGGPIRY